jgi:hypothetical protein
LRRKGIAVKSESTAWAEIQGTLARGDQRVADALLAAERLTPANWRDLLVQSKLDPQEFLRQRSPHEALPWNVIDSGVHAAYFERESQRADTGRTTAPCPPQGCVLCGVCEDEQAAS